ncbi:MAG: nicotinate-nucleotide--dimethylbenzimidazole phosphoribosyltransferase [Rhodobacterales bacterium]|nr:MAG: nicotinate-nucleotide--dimethylbenzimidazole phosphoribosyltransferase [Rhodobacterales bacterium]
MIFDSFDTFRTALRDLPRPDADARAAAEARNAQLTKPAGSLAMLEDLAAWLAAWQGTERPHVDAPQVAIFAGNHGVCAQGVSAYPPEVTVQMVAGFEAGFAAINQLAKLHGAQLSVHPIELDRPTADFTQGPAMSEAETLEALRIGWEAVDPKADLFIAGEMGIGNTTPAAALSAALLGGNAGDWTGRGTGVDDAGLRRKEAAVAAGLARHNDSDDALQTLARLGGREIAAMAGAIAGARAARVPVLLDGFICCAAAIVLEKAAPGTLAHCRAGHLSAEGAHARQLEALGLTPILSLGLRLGEGSGAATALGVVRAAAACQSGMATFAEAGVSTGE